MAHLHSQSSMYVLDDDATFDIDPDTGLISNLSGMPIKLMQNSHNSEQFTFRIPKTVENHNMQGCDIVEIHYTNTGTGTSSSNRLTNRGVYQVKDLVVSEADPNMLIFTWLVSEQATQLAGSLRFRIKFACTDSEDPSKTSYRWYTDTFTNITIIGGEDNSQTVVSQNADVLNQWRELLFHDRNDIETITGEGGKYELAVQHGYIYYISGYHEVCIKTPDLATYAAHIFVKFPEPTTDYPLSKMGFTIHPDSDINCYGSTPRYCLTDNADWEVSIDSKGGAIFYKKR